MKNFSLLLSLSIIISVIFSNCRKPQNGPDSADCADTKFYQEYNIKIQPAFMDQDASGNIYILGHWDFIVQLLKINANGELLWHKTYPGFQGKEQGIMCLDENSIFIKTSTNNYNYQLSEHIYTDVWIKNGVLLGPDNSYFSSFELADMYQPKLQLPNENRTSLIKLNGNGDIIWTKEFEGDVCNGHSFYKIDELHFLFLTSSYFGPYFELIENGGSVDTVSYPNDRNKKVLYKLNSDGNTIWSTDITNIFEVYRGGCDLEYYMLHSVTQNNNRIMVNTVNNTYELSLSGEILGNFQPIENHQGNRTYHMAKGGEKNNYFFCQISRFNNLVHTHHLVKIDLESKLPEWEIKDDYFPIHISVDHVYNLYTLHYNNQQKYVFRKYNVDGKISWENEFDTRTNIYKAIKASCNGGLLFTIYDAFNEKLILIKTGSDGSY